MRLLLRLLLLRLAPGHTNWRGVGLLVIAEMAKELEAEHTHALPVVH
jgi:hypothetical protein